MNQPHPFENLTSEEQEVLIRGLEKLIPFLRNERMRQDLHDPGLYVTQDTKSAADPTKPYRENLVWLGNDQSLTTFYLSALLQHEIFYCESEDMFRVHYGKTIPSEKFIVNKKRISEVVYLCRRLSAPDVKLLSPDYWHKILPKHFIDEFGEELKEGTVKTRASLALELCVRSEDRRKILDSIIEDALWANRNR